MESRSPKISKAVVYDGGVAGRRRLTQHPNYHVLSHNAVLPTDDKPDVEHYHTKKLRPGRAPALHPTLRNGSPHSNAESLERNPSNEAFGPRHGSLLTEY